MAVKLTPRAINKRVGKSHFFAELVAADDHPVLIIASEPYLPEVHDTAASLLDWAADIALMSMASGDSPTTARNKFTDAEKYACAQREVAMRVMVYPKWVEAGRMKRDKAEREIAIMKEIADNYDARGKRS